MNDLMATFASASTSRRSLIRNLGLASAAAGIVGSAKRVDAQTALTDVDILNFALNLEFLEAEFYTVATTGGTIDNLGITITGSGAAGMTSGGQPVDFPTDNLTSYQLAQELAANERYHVALLQNTITSLGGTPIAKPAINLDALSIGFNNQNDFLQVARIFEEIGVTAYGGAAPLIANSTVLGYAARILATEAEHVGFIRGLISQFEIATSALDPVDVPPLPSGPQYFSVNSDAITAVRTPGQVLYLAYGGAANATSGGFFPSGVNGAITTSSASPAVTDGVIFTIGPNPVQGSGGYATATISWGASSTVQQVQVRIGSPAGTLFVTGGPVGSATTDNWVTDGLIFYLQDISNGKSLTAQNTLATAIARVY